MQPTHPSNIALTCANGNVQGSTIVALTTSLQLTSANDGDVFSNQSAGGALGPLLPLGSGLRTGYRVGFWGNNATYGLTVNVAAGSGNLIYYYSSSGVSSVSCAANSQLLYFTWLGTYWEATI